MLAVAAAALAHQYNVSSARIGLPVQVRRQVYLPVLSGSHPMIRHERHPSDAVHADDFVSITGAVPITDPRQEETPFPVINSLARPWVGTRSSP
jgi:hypothetical protein